jgi:hypothetical protein
VVLRCQDRGGDIATLLEGNPRHDIVAARYPGGLSVLDAEWVSLEVRRRGSWRDVREEAG